VRTFETWRRGIVTGHRGTHHTDGKITLLYDLPVVIETLLVGF
jgi:PII-like signaling protein